jgi:predicted nucleic acid-binding protein
MICLDTNVVIAALRMSRLQLTASRACAGRSVADQHRGAFELYVRRGEERAAGPQRSELADSLQRMQILRSSDDRGSRRDPSLI